MNMKPNKISLVRIDKQQQRKVSTVTISKLMDKLKANVGNNELAMLRFKVKLLIEKTTPLDVDGVELAPMSQTEIVKTNDNNEVSALISFLTEKYKFR